MTTPDYSPLDHPAISASAFYPRRHWTPAPPGASDHAIAVADGLSLSARFFPVPPPPEDNAAAAATPTILYFYGNGETANDYHGIAPLYNRIGVNLFIPDYRGYGRSDGAPSFTAMLTDAVQSLDYLERLLKSENRPGPIFVMGRSMGRHSAFELAAHHGQRLRGVIIESGRPILGNFTHGLPPAHAAALESAYLAKVKSITLPSLVIHGEQDTLAPAQQAAEMHQAFPNPEKRLLIIPGAGHNDLLHRGLNEYFAALQEFTSR